MIILAVILLAIGAYVFDSFRSKPQDDKKGAQSKSKSKPKSKATEAVAEPAPIVRQRARPKKVVSEAEKEQIRKDKLARREQEEKEHAV